MTTSNPHEIERVRKRDELVAETERLAAVNRAENAAVETIESVIADREALKTTVAEAEAKTREIANERNSAMQEIAVLRAELDRVQNAPKDGA